MAVEHNFLYAYLVRQLRTKEYFRLFLIEGHWNIPNNRLRTFKKKKIMHGKAIMRPIPVLD